MSIQNSIIDRIERWKEFIKPDAKPGFMFVVHYEDPEFPVPPRPMLWPDRKDERIKWAWNLYEVQCRKAEILENDQIPYLSNVTGTEIFAEAFGCPVDRTVDRMPFALPIVRTPKEADDLKVPELSTSSLAYLFDIADELQRRGGLDAKLKLPDIQSPMDIAALIWDKTEFYTAMLEAPEAVRGLADKVCDLLIAFFDEWFSRYGNEYISHCPDYLMSGGITLSEDEIGAVSGEMFELFFKDPLTRLSSRFGGLGMHCCARARHQWQHLKELPGLLVLNLSQVWPEPDTYADDALPFFGNSLVQIHHGWNLNGDAVSWPGQFPRNTRVFFGASVKNREEAIALCVKLNQLREYESVSSF